MDRTSRGRTVWAVLSAVFVPACPGDPLSGRVFACDPDGPDTCGSGWVCQRVAHAEYRGICVAAGTVEDSGPVDPGSEDTSGIVEDPGPVDPGSEDTSEPDTIPEQDQGPEVCAPDCTGKQCGDDGCGGTCGTCPGPQDACIGGQCVCQPACLGKQCGDDGCGGTCGTCPAGSECQSGQCRPTCWDEACPLGYQKYDGCRCRVAPTGVTKCKRPGEETLVDCSQIKPGEAGYGQDGHFRLEAASGPLEFTDIGGGSVRDEKTGLTWSKAMDAQVPWGQAGTTCSNSGWHLPDVVELLSLVDYSRQGCMGESNPREPMWHPVFGTSCIGETRFWTAVPWSSSNAFGVDFHSGDVYGVDMGNYRLGVRCVRAGQ